MTAVYIILKALIGLRRHGLSSSSGIIGCSVPNRAEPEGMSDVGGLNDRASVLVSAIGADGVKPLCSDRGVQQGLFEICIMVRSYVPLQIL